MTVLYHEPTKIPVQDSSTANKTCIHYKISCVKEKTSCKEKNKLQTL